MSPLGGIRIFYSLSILWDTNLFSTRVKWFLKSNFRFSKTLSPGEPLQSRWSPTAPEDSKDTLLYSLETLCPPLLLFPTIDRPLWITTYNCRSYLHSQLLLLLQDALICSPLFRKSFKLTALQFFATWMPYWKFLALIEYLFIPSCSYAS